MQRQAIVYEAVQRTALNTGLRDRYALGERELAKRLQQALASTLLQGVGARGGQQGTHHTQLRSTR